jgi:hypothetical protein
MHGYSPCLLSDDYESRFTHLCQGFHHLDFHHRAIGMSARLTLSQFSFLSRRSEAKADEGAVACRVDLSRRSSAKTEAKRRLKDGGEQGILSGGGLPRVLCGGLGSQVFHGFQSLIFRMRIYYNTRNRPVSVSITEVSGVASPNGSPNGEIIITPVPEPSALELLTVGVTALLVRRRRTGQKRANSLSSAEFCKISQSWLNAKH